MVKDTIALVTGGGSGIGLATVEKLLENHARKVYIGDINEENGEFAVNNLNKKYGKDQVKFLKLDVTNSKEFRSIVEAIIKENERLDILINNAGILDGERILDINIGGVNNGLKLGMELMKKGSKIINTASVLGFLGFGQCPDYCATKHAVVGLTKSFAAPYWHDKTGISVMAICPGLTKTGIMDNLKDNDTVHYNKIKQHIFGHKRMEQTSDSVANGMITMLKSGRNGSFWISTDSLPVYEIEIPSEKLFLKINDKK